MICHQSRDLNPNRVHWWEASALTIALPDTMVLEEAAVRLYPTLPLL